MGDLHSEGTTGFWLGPMNSGWYVRWSARPNGRPNTEFSGFVNQIFSIFCMKLEDLKYLKGTEPDLLGVSIFLLIWVESI